MRPLTSRIVRLHGRLLLTAFTGLQLACGSASAATPLPNPTYDPVVRGASEDTAVFAGGCFWGIEAVYRHVKGVKSAVSGYSGGNVDSPSYEQVGRGGTGHAEAVQVIYDPSVVTYGQLLKVFFSVAHDPTQLNYQGPDHGTQYRSAIFYRTEEQKKTAAAYIEQLTNAKTFDDPIVTEVSALKKFWPAEDYHQDYLARHPNQPYIVMHDQPKLKNLKKAFPELYRK
jgi:peptide-methionine (S)-S-oxide reductase